MLFWICSASRVPLLLLLKINTSHYFCKLPGTFKMFLVPSGFWMWWTGNVKNSSYWTDHHLCPQLYPASSLFTYPLNPSLTTFAWPRMATHGHAWLHLAHPTLMPISCPFLPIHIHTHVNEAPCKFHETPSHDVFKHVASLLLPFRKWNEALHGDLCAAGCTWAAGCCFSGEMGLRSPSSRRGHSLRT